MGGGSSSSPPPWHMKTPGSCTHGVPAEAEVARTITESINDTAVGSSAASTAAAGADGGGHGWGGRAHRRHPPIIVAGVVDIV